MALAFSFQERGTDEFFWADGEMGAGQSLLKLSLGLLGNNNKKP